MLARVLFLGTPVCVVDVGEGIALVVMLAGEVPVLESVESMVLLFDMMLPQSMGQQFEVQKTITRK